MSTRLLAALASEGEDGARTDEVDQHMKTFLLLGLGGAFAKQYGGLTAVGIGIVSVVLLRFADNHINATGALTIAVPLSAFAALFLWVVGIHRNLAVPLMP